MGLREFLSKELHKHDISHGHVDRDERYDDEVEIHENLYVQLAGYCDKPYTLNLWKEDESTMYHFEFGINEMNGLITKIKELS